MIFTQHHITRNTASMLNFADRVKLFQWNFLRNQKTTVFQGCQGLEKSDEFQSTFKHFKDLYEPFCAATTTHI